MFALLSTPFRRPLVGSVVTALAGFALLLGISAPAAGDDRDLLREASGDPYVFIILDTSGSMAWAPKCTQTQFDASECGFVCPDGDCYVPLSADDPNSKFVQAKSALYEVIDQVDDVRFGFATYNQDELTVLNKHWLYKADGPGPNLPGWGAYPATNQQDVFGYMWRCSPGSGTLSQLGCFASDSLIADVGDTWERTRMQRLPKGGNPFSTTNKQTFFFRVNNSNSNKYAVVYTPNAGATLGAATISISVRVAKCKTNLCSDNFTNRETGTTTNVTFSRIGPFIATELGASLGATPPLPLQNSYFPQSTSDGAMSWSKITPSNTTCTGWEPNSDSGVDGLSGVNLKQPTVVSPISPLLNVGDVVPLDWDPLNPDADNRTLIKNRLAPNLNLVGETIPDFTVARYLTNTPDASGQLNVANTNARPLVAFGSTPLGASVSSFRSWFSGCGSGTCNNASGWRNLAAANDEAWGCRKTYLIVLTDGDETCSGSPCTRTQELFQQEGVKTFVVAFGVPQGSGNTLQCMAANGGTTAPIYPQNKQALVDALTDILERIREETRSFASAAVPSVQAAVEDRIYLTSFTPFNDASVWDGHLDAYLKPLPLTSSGLPDRGRTCNSTRQSGCRLWDAGDELYAQAVTPAQLAENPVNYNLGLGLAQRRVFYGQGPVNNGVPRTLRLFKPPADPANPLLPLTAGPDWIDLLTGFNYPLTSTTAISRAKTAVAFTLKRKQALIENNPSITTDDVLVDYVLGDIFHANPVVVGGPENFTYFLKNSDGYETFALKNRVRRKVIFVGANDGQLHAFDAGLFSATVVDDPALNCPPAAAAGRIPRRLVNQKFSNGTGRELFSFVPRSVMPVLKDLAVTDSQEFTVDSPVSVGDVFIDPISSGSDAPNLAHREWRTVVVGGLREGGKAYYALDVTQPDRILQQPICGLDGLESNTSYAIETAGSTSYVPSCLTLDGTAASNCGPLPYPAVLWEFEDKWSENSDGYPDLANSWSIPNIARIRVCNGANCDPGSPTNNIEDRHVAIFGGGLGQTSPDDIFPYDRPGPGDFLYMVDVATGKTIYKRDLFGMAPSEPAVVDTDLDGYADRIYIGTTAGMMYKVDMSAIVQLETTTVVDTLTGLVHSVKRIVDSDWAPFEIFDTGGRPIFFPPSVVFIGELGKFALAFGSGDRADLWSPLRATGRFYSILDENFQSSDSSLPLQEANYPRIRVTDDPLTNNLFLSPASGLHPGWFLDLDQRERLITKPFSLSGVLFFTSYRPNVVVLGDGDADPDRVCAATGESRIFVVNVTNANAIFREPDPLGPVGSSRPGVRFKRVPEFVTDPFVELSTTKNASVVDESDPDDPTDDQGYADKTCTGLDEVTRSLKELLPDSCRFANYTYNIETVRSDRGLVCVAPVPICIVEQNWGGQ